MLDSFHTGIRMYGVFLIPYQQLPPGVRTLVFTAGY